MNGLQRDLVIAVKTKMKEIADRCKDNETDYWECYRMLETIQMEEIKNTEQKEIQK